MHIWIIMDWNRRWAKQKWKLTFLWHTAGFNNARDIVKIISEKWIECFTLWALSKENLVKRSSEELTWIFKLLVSLKDFEKDMVDNNIKFDTIWDIEKLPKDTKETLSYLKEKTKDNTWLSFNIALVYSWQDEIVRATKKLILDWVNPEKLDEELFRTYLDVSKLPKIDLIIRTWIHEWTQSVRHSGFMLYDSAYSEYYFTHTLWPDFDEVELDKAIEEYHNTKRTKWK